MPARLTAHAAPHPDHAFRLMKRTVGIKRVKGKLVEYPTKLDIACACGFTTTLEGPDIAAWKAMR